MMVKRGIVSLVAGAGLLVVFAGCAKGDDVEIIEIKNEPQPMEVVELPQERVNTYGTVYFNEQGDDCYIGDWKNGAPNGQGELYKGGVKVFDGGWSEGRKFGYGTVYSSDGTGAIVFQGTFYDDRAIPLEENGGPLFVDSESSRAYLAQKQRKHALLQDAVRHTAIDSLFSDKSTAPCFTLYE